VLRYQVDSTGERGGQREGHGQDHVPALGVVCSIIVLRNGTNVLTHALAFSAVAVPLKSWWWPKRPARVPRVWVAGLLTCMGAALFSVSALVLKAGAVAWDESLFRFLNDVPSSLASVLTPLSHLFLPVGIVIVIVLATGFVVAWNRSIMPVAAAVAAAAAAWALANLAKLIANRPRPYEVVAGAVLRQSPAHGTSFPSSHTAVTVAVVIALVPFLPRALAGVAIAYAVLVGWSRVYLGVHYPLDILGGAGIGIAAGGATLLALAILFHRSGRAAKAPHAAAQPPGTPSL
jgi:undecaprenyl-diphosphatase